MTTSTAYNPSAALVKRVETHILENGMTLLHQHNPEAARVALYCFTPGGNCQDPAGDGLGTIDLIDRLLLKGTTTKNQEQLALAIDNLTLDLSVDTVRDYSLLSATFLEDDLKDSFDIIGDITHNATFDRYVSEKQKLMGELVMELDSPRAKASDLMLKTIFGGLPYGLTSSVFLEHLAATMDNRNTDALQAHYQKLYHPSRMIVSSVGPMPANIIIDELNRIFPKTAITPISKVAPQADILLAHRIQDSQRLAIGKEDSAQAHIYRAWIAPPTNHPDNFALAVMNTLFGAGGLSARLFIELRDKQGLAYHVRSSYDAYWHSGLLSLYIGTEPSNVEKCLTGFQTEIDKLLNTPVSEKELSETKANMLGKRSIGLETPLQQASYIGSNIAAGRSLSDVESVAQKIQAVTAEDIQRVAQTYFSQPSVISMVGPEASVMTPSA